MANPKSQQFEIIKNGPLCLDKYCADIVPFGEGFNKKNSPLIGGAISNIFSKETDSINQYVSNGNHEAWIDDEGDVYIDGKNTQKSFYNNYKFVVENIEGIDDSYLDYQDENTYLRLKNNRQTLTCKISDVVSFDIDYIESNTYKIIEKRDGTKYLVVAKYAIVDTDERSSVAVDVYDIVGTKIFSCDNILNYDIVGESATIPLNIPVEYNNIIIRFGKFENSLDYLLLVYLVNDKNEIYVSYEGNASPSVASIGYVHFSGAFIPSVPVRAKPSKLNELVIGHITYDGYIEFAGIYEETYDTNKKRLRFCHDSTAAVLHYNLLSNVTEIRFEESAYLGKIDLPNPVAFNVKPYACLYTSPFTDNIPGIRILFEPTPSDVDVGFIYCRDIEGPAIYNYHKNYPYYSISALVGDLVEDDYPLPKPVFNKRVIIDKITGSNTDGTWYEVLVDKNNMIQSFSYTRGKQDKSTCSNLGTLLVPMGSVSNERPYHFVSDGLSLTHKYVVYFDAYDKVWKKISIKSGIELYLIDDYLLINTTRTYNAININNLSDQIWANDWNNRFVSCQGEFSADVFLDIWFSNTFYGYVKIDSFLENKKEIKLSSAYNYYKDSNNIPSSQLPEDTIYLYTTYSESHTIEPEKTYYYNLSNMGSGCDIYDLEIYKNGIYNNSIHSNYALYNESIESKGFVDHELADTDYLVDSVYFTPSITMKFWETYSNKNLVDFDNLTYSLLYYGDIRKEKLIYALGTQYYGMEDIFIIQGQRYFVQNNKIYSFTVSQDNEIIENVVFITNIQGLKFKANTTKEAYFWSKNDSSLYIFTADNTLRKFYTATDIVDIYSSIYYPSLDAVVFCTNIGLLCINDKLGMFCIDNNTNGKLYLNPNGYITLFSDKLYYYNLWFLDNSWTKNNIKLSTKFYGLGSNVISITDTWYLRLFADKNLYEQMNLNRTGKLELSIDALTDQGLSTETKEIDIKESDWDKLTDTLYIRYQPKLQRGVGISLNVDSPFAIGYLGLGNNAETIQMSRPSMQV